MTHILAALLLAAALFAVAYLVHRSEVRERPLNGLAQSAVVVASLLMLAGIVHLVPDIGPRAGAPSPKTYASR